MAENKTKDVRSEGSINEKPCFETSDVKILMNLHKAALQKAADVARKSFDIENMQDVLINTMLSEDGKTMKAELGEQYEVGFVTQYLEFKNPSKDDIKKNGDDFNKAFLEINKEGLKHFQQKAFEVLKEYLKYFADVEPKMEKMVDFIPDYYGGKTNSKKSKEIDISMPAAYAGSKLVVGNKIADMDPDKMEQYLKAHSDKNKPRLGFKFGFTYVSRDSSSEGQGGDEIANAEKNGGK